MAFLAILLGLGLTGVLVGGLFDEDDTETPPEDQAGTGDGGGLPDEGDGLGGIIGGGSEGTEDSDLIVSSDRAALVEELAPGASGDTDFVDGPIVIDTLGGDDLIAASDQDDVIAAGAGNDVVYGGAGDDQITLGDGDDFYVPAPPDSVDWGVLDAGDDVVSGGAGADALIDTLGHNTLSGGDGIDLVYGVDTADEGTATPDSLSGGAGTDLIVADNGDQVETGSGADLVAVDLTDLDGDIDPVVITDFDPSEDVLGVAIDGSPTVTTTARGDGTGLDVIVNDVVVATLIGVDALDPGQIDILPAAYSAI